MLKMRENQLPVTTVTLIDGRRNYVVGTLRILTCDLG
jgi:hypothetical protein